MAKYLSKAPELKRQGRWTKPLCGGRNPEQSAKIRAGTDCNPATFYSKGNELKGSVINDIVPVWWRVRNEHHSGWDMSEFIKETKAR